MSICIMWVYPCLVFKQGLSIIGCMHTYTYNLALFSCQMICKQYILNHVFDAEVISNLLHLQRFYKFLIEILQRMSMTKYIWK